MYVILWRLRPHPSRESEFLAAYGAGGAWERLFGTAPGFLGTGGQTLITLEVGERVQHVLA